MTKAELINVRAEEEIKEHGSVGRAAIEVQKMTTSPDLPRAGKAFMRLVLQNLIARINVSDIDL